MTVASTGVQQRGLNNTDFGFSVRSEEITSHHSVELKSVQLQFVKRGFDLNGSLIWSNKFKKKKQPSSCNLSRSFLQLSITPACHAEGILAQTSLCQHVSFSWSHSPVGFCCVTQLLPTFCWCTDIVALSSRMFRYPHKFISPLNKHRLVTDAGKQAHMVRFLHHRLWLGWCFHADMLRSMMADTALRIKSSVWVSSVHIQIRAAPTRLLNLWFCCWGHVESSHSIVRYSSSTVGYILYDSHEKYFNLLYSKKCKNVNGMEPKYTTAEYISICLRNKI